MSETGETSKKRGFAGMPAEAHRKISRLGGVAAHACGKAHEFSSEEAQAAGKKGGLVVSSDRKHMADIGRRGGRARGKKAEKSIP